MAPRGGPSHSPPAARTTNRSRKHVAEGQHGDKTHARLIEQLHSGSGRPSDDARRAATHEQSGHEGKRRLVEERQQHDEAEHLAADQRRDERGRRGNR